MIDSRQTCITTSYKVGTAISWATSETALEVCQIGAVSKTTLVNYKSWI